MMPLRKSVSQLTLSTAAFGMSACTSVSLHAGHPIDTGPESQSFQRLIGTADAKLRLEVDAERSPVVAGHQYSLILLPVGRVFVLDPATDLSDRIRLEAALRGYDLRPESTPETRALLSVRLSELQVSGYDALFFRRPIASVTISARLSSPDGSSIKRECEAVGEDSAVRIFAFERELSAVYRSALESAVKKILSCLKL